MNARHTSEQRWKVLIDSICRLWKKGYSDSQVTQKLSGQRLRFIGDVTRTRQSELGLTTSYVEITEVRFKLTDGRSGFADGMLLVSDQVSQREIWKNLRLGDVLEFETEINGTNENPLSGVGITWSEFGNNEGCITIHTKSTRLIDLTPMDKD